MKIKFFKFSKSDEKSFYTKSPPLNIAIGGKQRSKMIKAIETVYNGYRFRSRLEARWAVFFDTLGIEYDYEPEGFDLGELGYYLPDFYLPEMETWAEVKGGEPSKKDFKKMVAFSSAVEQPIILLRDIPLCEGVYTDDCKVYIVLFAHFENWPKMIAGYAFDLWAFDGFDSVYWNDGYRYDEGNLKKFLSGQGVDVSGINESTRDGRKMLIELDKEYYRVEHGVEHPEYINGRCKEISFFERDMSISVKDRTWCEFNGISPGLSSAYAAARQARFEHGQVGAPKDW